MANEIRAILKMYETGPREQIWGSCVGIGQLVLRGIVFKVSFQNEPYVGTLIPILGTVCSMQVWKWKMVYPEYRGYKWLLSLKLWWWKLKWLSLAGLRQLKHFCPRYRHLWSIHDDTIPVHKSNVLRPPARHCPTLGHIHDCRRTLEASIINLYFSTRHSAH